jgi:hypothetical protein
MSAHSAAPWRSENGLILDATGWVIASLIDDDGELVNPEEGPADARLIAGAPELHDAASDLFAIVADERECYLESHRNQATGEIPDVCRPYLDRLDAALNKARAAFAKAVLP